MHPVRGPFVLASPNDIKVVSDLSVYLIRIRVTNLKPSCRFKILQTLQSCQCIVRHSEAA